LRASGIRRDNVDISSSISSLVCELHKWAYSYVKILSSVFHWFLFISYFTLRFFKCNTKKMHRSTNTSNNTDYLSIDEWNHSTLFFTRETSSMNEFHLFEKCWPMQENKAKSRICDYIYNYFPASAFPEKMFLLHSFAIRLTLT
jgi:hypothetical protein